MIDGLIDELLFQSKSATRTAGSLTRLSTTEHGSHATRNVVPCKSEFELQRGKQCDRLKVRLKKSQGQYSLSIEPTASLKPK